MRQAAQWVVVLGLFAANAVAADESLGLKKGTPDIKHAGSLAFGPSGVLFIGDTQQAAIFAIQTGDEKSESRTQPELKGINETIAGMVGISPKDVLINDLAVSPVSGNIYLSASRGRGPDAQPLLVKVDAAGKVTDVPLENISFAKATLPNAPAPGGEGRSNRRAQSITDLGYMDGRVFVAGLSNEEFASKLRSIPFPFASIEGGASIEIYHGAHGQYETRSPIRTFLMQEIEGQPHLLAAYTCTPLVKLPVADLKSGAKVKGTTIAELGNRNTPLDMVAYEKDGKNWLLIANTARGVMKLGTEKIATIEEITTPIQGTAGVNYETLDGWKGVAQLDLLDGGHAVVLQVDDSGTANLITMELP